MIRLRSREVIFGRKNMHSNGAFRSAGSASSGSRNEDTPRGRCLRSVRHAEHLVDIFGAALPKSVPCRHVCPPTVAPMPSGRCGGYPCLLPCSTSKMANHCTTGHGNSLCCLLGRPPLWIGSSQPLQVQTSQGVLSVHPAS